MHFVKSLFIFLLPLLAVAFQFQIPLGNIKDVRPISPPTEKTTTIHNTPATNLVSDPVPVGELMGGLLDSLDNIKSALDPEIFKALDTIFRSAAFVLDQERAKRVKQLISNANEVLTPEFVGTIRRLFEEIARARR
ncbi:hypothetical protein FE257_005381 [Aspergillus nanangensis]|uniref:Uncharacterized protein n=1 Tax=Aspergillus nanangensis TaxID=2582783 RepID=A0AAD4CQF7_ASPNN|nr:hypothetical protein FE257_005381 [Aspergillus nanangensis]